MGSLFNDWIKLFDDKNFKTIKDDPQELRSVSMLFLTIQQELKKVEFSLNKKIETLRSSYHEASTTRFEDQQKMSEDDEVTIIDSSPTSEDTENSIQTKPQKDTKLLKSPVFSRHRKVNTKKISRSQKLSPDFMPLQTKVSNNLYTPKKPSFYSKNLTDMLEDEDMFDSSIIGITPNIKIVKQSKSRSQCNKKRLNSVNVSSNSTVGQKYSHAKSTENYLQDSTMLDIDQILQEVAAEQTVKSDSVSNCSGLKSSIKNVKISSSFARDYDKLPEQPKSPKKTFVHKETIRGNAKKKLKGWSCKDCENFYQGMNLSEKELEKKMYDCSKHKSRFKPEEETIPGFWDLTIPATPEDQITQPRFIEESIGNESTIFNIYKQ